MEDERGAGGIYRTLYSAAWACAVRRTRTAGSSHTFADAMIFPNETGLVQYDSLEPACARPPTCALPSSLFAASIVCSTPWPPAARVECSKSLRAPRARAYTPRDNPTTSDAGVMDPDKPRGLRLPPAIYSMLSSNSPTPAPSQQAGGAARTEKKWHRLTRSMSALLSRRDCAGYFSIHRLCTNYGARSPYCPLRDGEPLALRVAKITPLRSRGSSCGQTRESAQGAASTISHPKPPHLFPTAQLYVEGQGPGTCVQVNGP
ncbi:hypothetical protein C2E23DRAFT_508670 [Lenzites betulinus]|nr:hypothetical protein C2E23DRAFT_508670 [Lenzites betulinus]